MKGIIFREFINLVETEFSIEIADAIITASQIKSNGSFTTIGTYPTDEMLALVNELSNVSKMSVPALFNVFGRHLFKRFTAIHATYVTPHSTVFELLRSLDNHIHVEVRKLYSEAELPSFTHEMVNADCMILDYRSKRMLADFAEGMLHGCIEHFNDAVHVDRHDVIADNDAYTRFTLTKQAHVFAS